MSRLRKYTEGWSYIDYVIALQLIIFPWFSRLMPLLVGLMVVVIILNKPKIDSSKLSIKQPLFWFFIFFGMHLLGLIWTQRIDEGVADIGMKLALCVIPFVFLFTDHNLSLGRLSRLLIIGLMISLVINYSYAVYRSIINAEDNQWAYFTESYFSFQMHRSYYAMYLIIGALAAVREYFKSNERKFFIVNILFVLAAVQTFSKVGIILLFILLLPYAAYWIQTKFGWKRLVLFGAFSLILFSSVFLISKTITVRFQKMIEAVTEGADSSKLESNSSRLIMWDASVDIISENLVFGTGTGDITSALVAKAKTMGYDEIAERKLNSHNQYLNSTAQLGVLGGLSLILILVTSILHSYSRKDLFYVLMSLAFMISLFFESLLERQDGVIPITLLLLVFLYGKKLAVSKAVSD